MRSLATVVLTAFAAVGALVVGRMFGHHLAGGSPPPPEPAKADEPDIEDAVEIPSSSRTKR